MSLSHRIQPEGVQHLLVLIGNHRLPRTTHLVGTVLPLWLNAGFEAMEVRPYHQLAGGDHVVIQTGGSPTGPRVIVKLPSTADSVKWPPHPFPKTFWLTALVNCIMLSLQTMS